MRKLESILQYSIYMLLFIALLYSYVFNINFKSKYSNENIIHGFITYYLIDGNHLIIELKGKEKILCNYYFKNTDEVNEFKRIYKLGDYVKLSGTLQIPSKNTVFDGFNYKEYLRYERISYLFKIDEINKIKDNNKLRFKIKNYIINRVEDNLNKDYLYAFILGNTKYIDSNVMNSFRKNGISHLFSVSGMHVSLISVLVLKLFNKFKFKNIIVSIIIVFYMFLTDFSPSILRAGIFFIILLLKKKYNINISNYKLMILLLSICIFIDPFIIYKIGFQYSYLISFTLILFSDLISNRKSNVGKLFIISFISFLVSIPITINNFNEINLLGIILNIFFVPLVSSILFPITLISIIIPIPYLNYFIDIFEYISIFLSKINIFTVVLCNTSIVVVFIYYIVIFYVLYSLKRKNYFSLIFIILFIFIHSIYPYFNSDTKVVFLDVGQGDSIFISLPNNKSNILIDTGGIVKYEEEWMKKNSSFSLSDNTISYLKTMGISKINFLIITHGDFDHMGEAINLANNFKVEKVIFNCGEFNKLEQDLIKVLDKKKIPYYFCIKELNIDNNKLYFLNNKDYGNENDNSNVIYTKLNNYKFLFMGDAGLEVEEDLIEKYNLQNIDILKVGHHGSKTSSGKEFINEINPKYSIISVGKNNRYGHPNMEALDNLKDTEIYRTDKQGSIMFNIKNNKLKIKTCAP